eukprot:TRINITY_DN17276_c0_g1_i7.p1 TRINITY_DN17276_c0_g1~~TRINITY_DN17276_c0_g1_i7.p1  ORF type:complete len:328 (-),score=27.85 TRINITY_DN17276_c0_g1_i7:209-1192(-)
MEQYAKIQNEDQKISVLAKERMKKEREKGRAVKAQRTIFDRCLTFRIMLQKAIASSNSLPHPNMQQYCTQANQEVRQLYKDVGLKARQLLEEMLQVMDELVMQNKTFQQGYQNILSDKQNYGKRKRGWSQTQEDEEQETEETWQRIQIRYNSLIKYQDEVLDRWHKRALLRSGKGAIRVGTGELHRGISQQVEIMMRDKERVLKRARLLSQQDGQPSYLCCPSYSFQDFEQYKCGNIIYNLETYDDNEFYQNLLKDYLEGSGGVAAAQLSLFQKQRIKKTRLVDRKASKGRKIRYVVQEKLVNFLLPQEQDVPYFANQLFRNLFSSD